MNKKENKDLRRPFIKEFFRNNKLNFALTLLASFIVALANLLISWLIKEIVDLMAGTGRFSIFTLFSFTLLALSMILLAGIIDYIFLPKFRIRAMGQYRKNAFEKLMKKGILALTGENNSLYISALSNDVNTIETQFIMPLQNIVQTGLNFIASLALMIWYSPLLTLIAIGFSSLPVLVSILLGNKAGKAERLVSDKKESYTSMLKDALSGFAVIKSFKAEKSISQVHEKRNKEVKDASKKRVEVTTLVSYASALSIVLVQLGVFLVAAWLAISGNSLTGGIAIVSVQLMNHVLRPIQVFPEFYAGTKASFALIDKLALALETNIPDEGEEIEADLKEGITIKNLNFAYEEGKPVLRDLNMNFAKGGCYAIVGGSGSGKSTILNLLMASSRQYEGEILYDGRELRTISPACLYDLVSIIHQNVFIFNNTIRDNITMFSEFPDELVNRAASLSGLKKLLDEKGDDYLCGENGSGLSGGEKQRISIARALLRQTPVLLVDEATASLDNESSSEVINAILNLDGYTRIIVTHDLEENTLKSCREIFTLKDGLVVERGSFEELMEEKGYFYSLFTISQT